MPISLRNVIRFTMIALTVFVIGFMLSSGIAFDLSKKVSDKVIFELTKRFHHHIFTLEVVDAKHYFLLPIGRYTIELHAKPLSLVVLAGILANSIFNILFQPVFLCPFTPQVILNAALFPFFLYGAVRYFKKAWPLLVLFIILSFLIGAYDSVIEPLIRHGMSCELIYLLVSSAGFTGWIVKGS